MGAKPHIADQIPHQTYTEALGWNAGNIAEYLQFAKVFISRL